jgi:TetR/AcrR family transcriptional repressor of nem operon
MNTKEKIITTATELFWLGGYKNTSVNDILTKAQVSKGSFFHHFKDKKTLFMAVIDDFYCKELTPLFAKYLTNEEQPAQQIINFCEDINTHYQKYHFQGGCLLGNMALELSDIDEVFRNKLDEIFTNWHNQLYQIISKVKPQQQANEIASYIIWGLEGLTLTAKVHKNKNKNNIEFNSFIKILEKLLNE